MSIKRYALLAGGYTEEDPEGTLVEFEDHERALSATRENNQALLARLEVAKMAYDQLRNAVDAIPTATLKFWLATRHIEGFDPATEFCRLALEMRGEKP